MYYYPDAIKEKLAEQIKQRDNVFFVATGTTPEKEIALLNELRCSSVVFTEKELQEQKLNSKGFKSLFNRLDLVKNNIFYFSCFDKKMDSLTFLKKVALFKTMFLKNQPNLKGEIKSVEVKVINPKPN